MRTCLRLALTASAAFLATLAVAPRASAGIVFYTNEATFNAAAPALSTQTFASATIAPIGISVFANPLNSATNNAVFSAGSILPGLTIASSASHSGQELGAVATGIFGNPAKGVYNNFAGDTLNLSFSPNARAVGLGALNPSGSSEVVSVFSPGGSLLATQTFAVPANGAEGFIGAIATGGDQIGTIGLLGGGAPRFAGVDRVTFALGTSAVPEPSSFVLTGLACAGATAVVRRARRKG